MFERPILFYSEYCIHSINFINVLIKHQEIYDTFIRVNIDPDLNTKKRPEIFYEVQKVLKYKITEVPTIVIEKGEYVLTGSEAFKWLEGQLNSNNEKEVEELEGFNSIEMGSFSDSYSLYGSNGLNDDVREQSFKFLGKPEIQINTPQETSGNVSSEDYNLKQRERESVIKGGAKVVNQFVPNQSSINSPPPMNFDRSLFNGNGNMSQKQKDFDSRYQQMLAERQKI
jgi:hypothetical protein